jgi:vitellogenic carboxypeptidase-like protein
LDGDLYPYPSYFKNVTGFDFYFNYLHSSNPDASDPTTDFAVYVQRAEVRKAIHVGNQPFGGFAAKLVEQYLQQDSVQ